MTCPMTWCPECGDVMIHQSARTGRESSSALGQYVHDTYPTTFYWCDIDGVVFKKMTRVMRVMEHKDPGRPIKPSQQNILPLLAIGIDLLVKVGTADPESGVFAVWSEHPHHVATVARIRPGVRYETDEPQALDVDQWSAFVTGLRLSEVSRTH